METNDITNWLTRVEARVIKLEDNDVNLQSKILFLENRIKELETARQSQIKLNSYFMKEIEELHNNLIGELPIKKKWWQR